MRSLPDTQKGRITIISHSFICSQVCRHHRPCAHYACAAEHAEHAEDAARSVEVMHDSVDGGSGGNGGNGGGSSGAGVVDP